eukprot:scaffold142101_cov31-Tisochrysis_lutea.AAC.3
MAEPNIESLPNTILLAVSVHAFDPTPLSAGCRLALRHREGGSADPNGPGCANKGVEHGNVEMPEMWAPECSLRKDAPYDPCTAVTVMGTELAPRSIAPRSSDPLKFVVGERPNKGSESEARRLPTSVVGRLEARVRKAVGVKLREKPREGAFDAPDRAARPNQFPEQPGCRLCPPSCARASFRQRSDSGLDSPLTCADSSTGGKLPFRFVSIGSSTSERRLASSALPCHPSEANPLASSRSTPNSIRPASTLVPSASTAACRECLSIPNIVCSTLEVVLMLCPWLAGLRTRGLRRLAASSAA